MAIVILLSLVAVSCRQDNIFQIIASETAPRKPRIEGAPTNMVVFNRGDVPIMYVASGRLHWYAKAPEGSDVDGSQWDLNEYHIPQPGGKIISLAVTSDGDGGERLYALCRDGNSVSATLRYIESDGADWVTIPPPVDRTYPVIQSIYADSSTNRLFAGAGKNDANQATYAILYLDNETDTLKLLRANTSIFSGAVSDGVTHYLSTRGNGSRGGIFPISEAALKNADQGIAPIDPDSIQPLSEGVAENESGNSNRMFMSIIKLKNGAIIAVERNGGALYKVQNGSFERMRYNNQKQDLINIGKYATEAITLWERIDSTTGVATSSQIVIGIQGGLFSTTTSSHTYGYVEFELDPGSDSIVNRHDPPSQSVDNQDRYTASLGKHPLNHLFQAPQSVDENMTFFASTQTAGLWSYRDRPDNGGLQWNAEE